MTAPTTDLTGGWHPVATEQDLTPRTVYRTSLLNRELVLWRADDGYINVWENRCLHRGVRLSIGSNEGSELVCRYHGWRYSNRTGGCTYVPAHPEESPPRTITSQTLPSVERFGLVWTSEDPLGDAPRHPLLNVEPLALRSLPVNAPYQTVLAGLANHRFLPSRCLHADLGDVETTTSVDGLAVTVTSHLGGHLSTAVFFVQPLSDTRSTVRPVLAEGQTGTTEVLRHHAARLARFARITETGNGHVAAEAPAALETPVLISPSAATSVRTEPFEVTVADKRLLATDIAAFELTPADGQAPPTWRPGDHLDVHLPNDLVRQYSLTNQPGMRDRYRIAVKLDESSQGGSAFLHHEVEIGDVLRVSEPRSGFPLRRNVPETILVAGGIGITPLLSMAGALAAMDLSFSVHYFAAAEKDLAFVDELDRLNGAGVYHVGLTPAETATTLEGLLAHPSVETQIYGCGPPPMLDALRTIAKRAEWPDDAVHFEYFQNTTEIASASSFTVELARSARTLEVPPGSSILDVLRTHEIPIVSSCEQGACGTCIATVIDGEPQHQDVYLNATERSSGALILTCVSRSYSDRLVLDL